MPAYSNYGASLGGYIVARASGMPFEQYIEEQIFKPLRMEHSTFRQPVPESLREHLSNSYVTASSDKPVPFEFGSDAPAGALSAPAPDMAQFMMAHLNGGVLPGGDESNRILKPETTELMHSVANRPGAGRRCDGARLLRAASQWRARDRARRRPDGVSQRAGADPVGEGRSVRLVQQQR